MCIVMFASFKAHTTTNNNTENNLFGEGRKIIFVETIITLMSR